MAESITIYDVLKGTKAKKMDSAVIGSHNGKPPASHLNTAKSIYTISIMDLLGNVKDNYPEHLPDALRSYYGVTEQKEKGLIYSTHETDNISNRDLLANAFEGITKSSPEYKLIQEYKGRIKILNEYEAKLAKLNAEIRQILFSSEGKRDTQKLKDLQAEAKKVAENINRNDKKLLSLEASEPLRKVIVRERKKEAQKTREHINEIQQNKKARAEQTELRHKIRKAMGSPAKRTQVAEYRCIRRKCGGVCCNSYHMGKC